MTSREELEVALKVKVLSHRTGRVESAASHKDVAGMLSAVADVAKCAAELQEQLQRIFDSAEHMHHPSGEAV